MFCPSLATTTSVESHVGVKKGKAAAKAAAKRSLRNDHCDGTQWPLPVGTCHQNLRSPPRRPSLSRSKISYNFFAPRPSGRGLGELREPAAQELLLRPAGISEQTNLTARCSASGRTTVTKAYYRYYYCVPVLGLPRFFLPRTARIRTMKLN